MKNIYHSQFNYKYYQYYYIFYVSLIVTIIINYYDKYLSLNQNNSNILSQLSFNFI